MRLINEAGRTVFIPKAWENVLTPGLKAKRGFNEFDDTSLVNPDISRKKVIVERPMGGLGDLVCIKPSVELLSRTNEVTFTYPSEFYWMYRDCRRIASIDYYVFVLNYIANLKNFGRLIYLKCPAGEHEEKSNFRPTKNRIENFAEAIGVKPKQPKLKLNTSLCDPKLDKIKEPKIGIVLEAANPLKTYPLSKLLDVAEALKNENCYVVTISPNKSFAFFDYIAGVNQERLTALMSQLDVIVTCDTGTLHIAGALNKPTIGLFGPTDGKLTCKYYPTIKIIQKLEGATLCFRPCYYNVAYNKLCCNPRTFGSCMLEISPKEICNAVREKLA